MLGNSWNIYDYCTFVPKVDSTLLITLLKLKILMLGKGRIDENYAFSWKLHCSNLLILVHKLNYYNLSNFNNYYLKNKWSIKLIETKLQLTNLNQMILYF